VASKESGVDHLNAAAVVREESGGAQDAVLRLPLLV
jgi:hypothetical protein